MVAEHIQSTIDSAIVNGFYFRTQKTKQLFGRGMRENWFGLLKWEESFKNALKRQSCRWNATEVAIRTLHFIIFYSILLIISFEFGNVDWIPSRYRRRESIDHDIQRSHKTITKSFIKKKDWRGWGIQSNLSYCLPDCDSRRKSNPIKANVAENFILLQHFSIQFDQKAGLCVCRGLPLHCRPRALVISFIVLTLKNAHSIETSDRQRNKMEKRLHK